MSRTNEARRESDHALQRRHLKGDAQARNALIERYLPLARQLALRYRDRSEPVADLTQVAYLGLIGAVDRWDPERGTAFSTFAVPTILGQLRRHFRDSTWLVRPPRELQELWLDVSRTRDELWQELGRSPTARDVADRLGVTVEAVSDSLHLGAARIADSLDELLRPDEADGVTGLERSADPVDAYAAADASIALEQISGVLGERARTVLRLRYGEDMLQREIADHVGCSQMHVSRILREAISTLSEHVSA